MAKTPNTVIDVSKLTIEHTKNPAPKPEKSTLVFGKVFSDHMLEIDWTAEEGWGHPYITPRHNLSLDPAASVLHYAIECFEGMKAFKGKDGKVRMFRPMMNMERMNRSGQRVGLPPLDPKGLLECIKALVKLDESWVPEGEGFSLYIRPTYISTHAAVGVCLPTHAKIFVILSPVGPYYPTGWKPVKLLCSEGYCRAWPGGSGCYKIGGNYAITLVPQKEAAQKGYTQVLWLSEGKVTEVGTMNFMLVWETKTGERELITCPVVGDMILPGVTRDSVLNLARKWGDIKVTERDYTIDEVVEAIEQGRVLEAFGTGTAAVVSPVCGISYKGKEYTIKNKHDPNAAVGAVTKRAFEEIQGISYGEGKWAGHAWVDVL